MSSSAWTCPTGHVDEDDDMPPVVHFPFFPLPTAHCPLPTATLGVPAPLSYNHTNHTLRRREPKR